MIDHGREIFHNKASSMLTVVDVLILAKIIVTFVLSITPRGGNPGNSWSGCAARSSNPDPISDTKNVIFNTRAFSDLAWQKLCYHYLD